MSEVNPTKIGSMLRITLKLLRVLQKKSQKKILLQIYLRERGRVTNIFLIRFLRSHFFIQAFEVISSDKQAFDFFHLMSKPLQIRTQARLATATVTKEDKVPLGAN